MYQFSLGISSLLGGFVAAAISIPLVMWISVIPQALNVLVALSFVEPRVHARGEGNIYSHLREAFLNIVRNPRLRTLSAASVLQFAIGESSWLFRPVFIAALWPTWAIGVWQMSANMLAALSFYLSGRLIRRFGEFRLMIGGMSISEGMNLAALLLSNGFSPVLMSINSIFYGVNTVAVSGLMQRDFTPQQRATMGSLTSFGGSLAFALVSFLVGGLADRIGAIPALVVTTLLTVLPISLFYRSFRVPARAATAQAAASD